MECYLLSDGFGMAFCGEAPYFGNDLTCSFLREVQMRATQSTTVRDRSLLCIWYHPGS